MPGTHNDSRKFQSLHALRGLAAFAIVFWHWQHFFYIGTGTSPVPNFNVQDQPLFPVFEIFYEVGWLAVDLFFSISGFILFWLYSDSISRDRISAFRFTVLRFSRLYPLHLATLLAVALMQAVYFKIHDSPFVYPVYDAKHFILSFFLLQSIGLESAPSYNWPSWSISVEMIVYAVFFVICRRKWTGVVASLAMAAVALFLFRNYYEPLARGLGSFFLGGVIYHAFQYISNSSHSKPITSSLVVITFFMWVSTVLFVYDWLPAENMSYFLSAEAEKSFYTYFPAAILFPLTVISLALTDGDDGSIMSRFSFFGDISYSVYLWHFPLQILFVLLNSAVGGTYLFFTTEKSLLLFFVALIMVSMMSFHFLEKPLQKYLRSRWIARFAHQNSVIP